MEVPQEAINSAEQAEKDQRKFIPTIKHVYPASLASDSYPKYFRDNAKPGEIWFNGEKRVAGKEDEFVVVPISFRGRYTYETGEGKETLLNPCFSESIKPVKNWTDFDKEVDSRKVGGDILVYIPCIDEFAVIIFKPAAISDFKEFLSVADGAIKVGSRAESFTSKKTGKVNYLRFEARGKADMPNVPDATQANYIYQLLHKEDEE